MSDQWLLATNPEKKDYKGPTRDIDNQQLVKALHAYGHQPVFVKCDDKQIFCHYIPEDIEEFENKYVSNIPILLSISMFAAAEEYWKNIMTLWNSQKRARQRE